MQELNVTPAAPVVSVAAAQQRLDAAWWLLEDFEQHAGAARYESVLVLPATQRTNEHRLRAVTERPQSAVTSEVSWFSPTAGWVTVDTLAEMAGGRLGRRFVAAEARGLLQAVQMQQLLFVTQLLS
ncbi:hypothetical protein [Curtobacterium sp. MCBD17_040]|uniref:hypothetical protein n=1 Tax=Curtobacterium sp. MCBD17_040 TaxID=2175674 RepID=UPI000DA84EA9|nr:hypothetical protein [Curtobacterium sp. MCBD17_040]WIB65321.1 hypothetical protein DEI94_18110 [Curtobacterium sp. MCBD17_040]